MLIDTNVFIDLLRGFRPAVEAFDKLPTGQNASIITKYELIVGTQNKRELVKIFKNLKVINLNFLPVTPSISDNAEIILKKYFHSYGVTIEDALISATALVHNEKLVTRNTKHFSFIPNLKLLKPY